MLDFTSSLYLGLTHSSRQLPPWRRLTTGQPAALCEPVVVRRAAAALAALIGCDAALLSPSTLHVAWDLFGTTVFRGFAAFVDARAYRLLRWGVERAAARGMPARSFPHHDPSALRTMVRRQTRRPLIICDGLVPAGGGLAPLREYLSVARDFDGMLLLDDTQALGVLGTNPDVAAPYGRGGGGSLRHGNVAGPDIVVVASLAKALGLPVAVVAGSRAFISQAAEESEVRVHCSPVSVAMAHLTEHTIAVNAAVGDTLRRALAERVRQFRSALGDVQLSARGGLFPVQAIAFPNAAAAGALHAAVERRGVGAVLHAAPGSRRAQVSFLLTARHTSADVASAIAAIAEAAAERWRATQATQPVWVAAPRPSINPDVADGLRR